MAGRFSTEAIFKGIDRFSAPVTRMQSRMDRFTRGITSGAKMVGKLGLMAGGVMVAGFVAGAIALHKTLDVINEITDRAGDLADRSARLKFPVEDLQTWAFAAEQSGVANEVFEKSLDGLAKRLGEAKNGTGALTSALKKSNPALLKQLKGTKDTAEALDLSIKALRAVEDPTKRAALANAMFGRAGAQMSQMASESADAIAGLRAEALANGVVTLEQAKAAELWGDTVNSLKRAFGGLVQGILLPLVPQLTQLAQATRNWIVENKELIGQKFEGLKVFLAGLAEHLPTIMKWAKFFGLIAAAIGVVLGVLTAASVVFLATLFAPLIAITAAWAFFPKFFEDLWEDVKSIASATGDFLIGIWNSISDAFTFVFGGMGDSSSGFADSVSEAWAPIGRFFSELWGSIKSVAVGTFEFIVGAATIYVQFLRLVWSPVIALFEMIWAAVSFSTKFAWEGLTAITGAAHAVLVATWAPVAEFFGALWGAISQRVADEWQVLTNMAESAYKEFTELWKPVTVFFADLWKGIIDAFNAVLGPIFDKVESVVKAVRDVGKMTLGTDGGDGSDGQPGADGKPGTPPRTPQVVSPARQAARANADETHSTTTEKVVLEIKDPEKRTEFKRGSRRGSNLQMPETGGFR